MAVIKLILKILCVMGIAGIAFMKWGNEEYMAWYYLIASVGVNGSQLLIFIIFLFSEGILKNSGISKFILMIVIFINSYDLFYGIVGQLSDMLGEQSFIGKHPSIIIMVIHMISMILLYSRMKYCQEKGIYIPIRF